MSLLAHRPRAVAFDINETLFELSGLRLHFETLGLPPYALEWWFAVLLRDGMALAAAGDTAPFSTLAVVALDEVSARADRQLPRGAASELLAAFAELPAHPDVAPALELLVEAGIPAIGLTNGSAATTDTLIERAGLSALVSRVLSVEDVGHWKPRPEPYRFAARQAGVQPERLAMVAVHPWDLHGAAVSGLVTGWVNRTGRSFPAVFNHPHLQAPSLDVVVTKLLDLPER